jgi:hypothetical protein
MLKQKVFTKVIKNTKLGGLGIETQRSIKSWGGVRLLKVRVSEFATLKVEIVW